jgi:hypothetical protein
MNQVGSEVSTLEEMVANLEARKWAVYRLAAKDQLPASKAVKPCALAAAN